MTLHVIGAIGSNALIWLMTPVVMQAHNVEALSVSLTIYGISVISTAGFTWAVARAINRNERRTMAFFNKLKHRRVHKCEQCDRKLCDACVTGEDIDDVNEEGPTLFG